MLHLVLSCAALVGGHVAVLPCYGILLFPSIIQKKQFDLLTTYSAYMSEQLQLYIILCLIIGNVLYHNRIFACRTKQSQALSEAQRLLCIDCCS